ncbi:hypothetical protein HNP33_004226 [Comamonas odontotermitis]|uniref:Uncharacterized protein n=1 Tax=Comamonas odontotermitis TaxID=379895 RepID=A0ABR6RLP4_9BURK|nr:hypothetical protein [Comamonas odontotermitis]MBB6580095.1 hypothetical protein [Comamonas odontotermitis]
MPDDKTEAQPEALRLADSLIGNAEIDECEGCNPAVVALERSAAAELRRQHAEIQQLKAQLSARQAVPDGWRIALERLADPRNKHFAGDAQIVARDALSAAPPPPEREPLTAEQIAELFIEMYGQEPVDITEFAEVCGRVEAAHGIGATNE